jgi:hypothetical protein
MITVNALWKTVREQKYIIFLGLSSLIALVKVYAYSFLLDDISFAAFNLYLLAMGFLTIFLTLGSNLRCHTVLPKLNLDDSSQFVEEIRQSKTVVLITTLVVMPVCLLIDVYLFYGAIQGCLYSLFFIDQIGVKSKGKFTQFAVNNFVRNFLILSAGLLAGAYFRSVEFVIYFEILACALLALYRRNVIFIPKLKGILTYIVSNQSYLYVTTAGLLMLYVERMIAVELLTPDDFALFSYLYLLCIAVFTFQQFINTRFITEVSISESISMSLKRALKRSILMLVLSSALMLFMYVPLSMNSNYFLAIDLELYVIFSILAVLKGVDFFQTIYITFERRGMLLIIQLFYLLTLCLTQFYFSTGLKSLLLYFCFFYALYLLMVFMGGLYFVKKGS